MSQEPKVGIGVLIRYQGKLLFWKRKSEHWKGTRAPPGGKLEFMEDIFECAKRETLEETWIEITNLNIWKITNDIFTESNKHYITILVTADYKSWEKTVMEPDKCERWEWVDRNNLPSPLFLTMENAQKDWFNPFEI